MEVSFFSHVEVEVQIEKKTFEYRDECERRFVHRIVTRIRQDLDRGERISPKVCFGHQFLIEYRIMLADDDLHRVAAPDFIAKVCIGPRAKVRCKRLP